MRSAAYVSGSGVKGVGEGPQEVQEDSKEGKEEPGVGRTLEWGRRRASRKPERRRASRKTEKERKGGGGGKTEEEEEDLLVHNFVRSSPRC